MTFFCRSTTAISIILGIVAVLGNGLVIYIAFTKQNLGPLRYLNEAVVSLAFTDLLTGLVGFPPTIVYYYWGKQLISVGLGNYWGNVR